MKIKLLLLTTLLFTTFGFGQEDIQNDENCSEWYYTFSQNKTKRIQLRLCIVSSSDENVTVKLTVKPTEQGIDSKYNNNIVRINTYGLNEFIDKKEFLVSEFNTTEYTTSEFSLPRKDKQGNYELIWDDDLVFYKENLYNGIYWGTFLDLTVKAE